MAASSEPTGRNWWQWCLIALVVLAVAVGLWWYLAKPSDTERNRAGDAACKDASALLAAGLLDEARAAYHGIAAEKLGCAKDAQAVFEREATAAHDREQGDQYVRSARLSRKAEKRAEARDAERAVAAFEEARLVAIRRAIAGYVRALTADPHDAATRQGLRDAVSLMAVPPDLAANARCRVARGLRRAHALEQAGMVYAQALRTGRTTQCLDNELDDAREDRAAARRLWRRGEIAELADKKQDGRGLYVDALALDPSLAAARKSLTDSESPDPHAGTVGAQMTDVVDWSEGAVDTGEGWASWLSGHTGAAAVATVLVGLVLLGLSYLVLRLTKFPRGRRVIGWFHLPDYCCPHLLISPFSPAGNGDTSTTVFAHWLPVEDPRPEDRGDETVNRSDTPLEAWDEPRPTADDLASVFGAQAGVLAAMWAKVKRSFPREETHFVGYALDRCEHGPGLRVLVKNRRGAVQGADFWWATDLPGPPLTAEGDEAEARHSLAIYAAAWARKTADL